MAQFLLPIIFVVLWSSAFVAGKAGVQHATPFAFLAVRFSIVALIFIVVAVGLGSGAVNKVKALSHKTDQMTQFCKPRLLAY